jgi:hypothetical protein
LLWWWETPTSGEFLVWWQTMIDDNNRLFWAYKNIDDSKSDQNIFWAWIQHFEQDWLVNELTISWTYNWLNWKNNIKDADSYKISTTFHKYLWDYWSLIWDVNYSEIDWCKWKWFVWGWIQYSQYLWGNNWSITWSFSENLWKESVWLVYNFPIWEDVVVWFWDNYNIQDDANTVGMQLTIWWKLPNPSKRFLFKQAKMPVLSDNATNNSINTKNCS